MFSQFASSIQLNGLYALVFIVVLFAALGLVVAIVLSPGIIVAAEARKVAKRYVDTRANTVIAQYDAPYGLTPAEIGLLYDMNCGDKEVQATLLSLAYRKIITIQPNGSVTVNDPAAFDQLAEYEQIAVRLHDKQQALPAGTLDTLPALSQANATFEHIAVQLLEKQQDLPTSTRAALPALSQANATMSSLAIPIPDSKLQFTVAVQKSLRTKGYALKSYSGTMLVRVILLALLLGLWPLAFAAVPIDVNGVVQPAWSHDVIGAAFGIMFVLGIFLFPVYIFVSYLILRIWTKIAGRTWLNTKQVRKLWPELEGYRLFLEQTDLAALQADARDGRRIIDETLPYAMVFNLDTKWKTAA